MSQTIWPVFVSLARVVLFFRWRPFVGVWREMAFPRKRIFTRAYTHRGRERLVTRLQMAIATKCLTQRKKKKPVVYAFILLPKCRERHSRIVRIVCAIMCIFSKFTSPSRLVLLPSCANVMSLSSSGMNGTTGGCSLPTKTRYARWLRIGSISASNSAKSLRNFDGNLSHVCDSREHAICESPMTTAKNALRFWYSLQLQIMGGYIIGQFL